jgi:hypothetical protein
MKSAVEIASCGMIYVLSFIKINSGIKKFLGGIHMHHTHRQQGNFISLLLFLQIKGSMLTTVLLQYIIHEIVYL